MAVSSSPFDLDPVSAVHALPPFAQLKEIIRGDRAPVDLTETRQVLTELARRKSGRLPAALLVEQTLRVTGEADWQSRRAALDALLRRVGFAMRDELTIAERPRGRAVLGRYVLSGKGGKAQKGKAVRPYNTELYSLEPLHVSCDCADFLRSSLGLCKHLLVVLEDLAKASARSGAAVRASQTAALATLRWDPVRSWSGDGDRLTGLEWDPSCLPPAPRQGPSGGRKQQLAVIDAAFEAGRAKRSVIDELARRTSLLEALTAAYSEKAISAESAAIALVRLELEVARRQVRGRDTARDVLAQLKSLRRKLYPYQRQGISRFIEQRRLLLADDMGLGKTTQAIAACHALSESGHVERGLLIVPAPLKDQWLREWHATTDRVPLSVVEGRAEERAELFRQTRRGFLVMNYEQLLRDLESVQRFDPQIVVLDEAQRIKNWATKSSAYVMSLRPEWRLVLTGTPMENRLEELATLLDWVDDTALAPKWRLVPWHTAWRAEGRAESAGARHLDTLRSRLSPCMLRRVRRDVLSQLPPRTDVRVPVEMTSQQREAHDALIAPIAQLLSAGRRRPLRQAEFLKLMQLLTQQRIVSNGMAQLQFEEVWPTYSGARADDALLSSTCSPKLPELRRLLAELVLEQGRKVVVFSQWRRMLRLCEWAVRDLLEEQGLSSVFFTGEESQRQRTQNIVEFHEDPSVRVMFSSDAGSVGLNLQRAANACINLELPWNPAVLEQRIGRIYRLGQEHPIDVFHLVTEYGIEARIAGLLGNKRALFSGLFDGTSDSVRFDTPTSFLSQVERLVEPVEVPTFISDDGPELAREEADDTGPSGHDEGGDLTPSEEPRTSPPTPRASSPRVAELLEHIAVTRTEDGGLRLAVPPEAAAEVAELLEGLATLLRKSPDEPSSERLTRADPTRQGA